MLPYRPLQELQQQAVSNLQLTQPWALQPQLGLDALGQPLPYIDLSKQDVVAEELNRLLAPVPAVAAALGWGAQQLAQQQQAAQAQGQPTAQPTTPTAPQPRAAATAGTGASNLFSSSATTSCLDRSI